MRMIAILAAVAAPALASAQPRTPEETFDQNYSAYKARLADHFARAEGSLDSKAQQRDKALATPELAPISAENTTTAADALAAAVSTDLGGVNAGISLAPAKLMGDLYSPWAGFTLSAASLEDEGFRAGVGWVYARHPTLADIAPHCKFDDVLASAHKLRNAYIQTCNALPRNDLPAEAGDRSKWVQVALACGRDVPPEAASLVAEIRTGGDALFLGARALVEASGAFAALALQRSALKSWVDARQSFTSCVHETRLEEAVRTRLWEGNHHKLGVSVHGDFFPVRFGFQPDEEAPMTNGEVHQFEGRLEYQFSRKRFTFTVGIGAGYTRATTTEDFELAVSPSAGVRVLVTALGKQPLEQAVLDENAPLIAIGFGASGLRAFNVPDTHESSWNKVDLSLFADFTVSKELAFRLGVPLRTRLVTREADPDAMPTVAEKHGLQWTLPVFIATVLKL